MNPLIEPKEIEIPLRKGGTKTFRISYFPAVEGREITTQYPISATPRLGDYKTNEALMLKLMAYIEVVVGDGIGIRLTTKDLINSHFLGDWEALIKLEWAMMEYNVSFFGNGKASSFLDSLQEKVPELIMKTLMAFSQQSSAKNTPPSTN